MREMDLKAVALLWIIKLVMCIYDIITFPIYFLLQQPWKKWELDRTQWGQLLREEDPYSPVTYIQRYEDCDYSLLEKFKTLDEAFRTAIKIYGNKDCMGVREVTCETREYHKNGRVLKKVSLGDYKWFSYNDINERIEKVANGFLELGIQPKTRIMVYAETRIEWNLVFQAAVRLNVTVATMYATFGEDEIIHGINETEVTHIVTSQDLLSKLKVISGKIPTVTHIIYMENLRLVETSDLLDNISIHKFSEVEELGENCIRGSNPEPPAPDDIAIILYTSGSTGIPKGVRILHKQMMSTIVGFAYSMPQINSEDQCINFLPMAHVLEIVLETFLLINGIRIGYASPFTLTSKSPGIMAGCAGDFPELKPTIMVAVPLMLDRIRKGINAEVIKKSVLAQKFFYYAIDYKLSWFKRGFQTPLLNRLVFKKLKDGFGGRLRYITSGGAPLSPDTQNFIRMCFDVKVNQGYGATETCASATVMNIDDYSTGRIGAPIRRCYVRLVDWPEGNYSPSDQPNPRGEMVIGGDCVADGYFKKEELTEESFTIENDIRWFYTGDIGELEPDGTFKIIDRKKDIVKLQHGEYVSLGKVELELKSCLLVDNICAVGNSFQTYLVALITPNLEQLRILAKSLNKEHMALRDMCRDPEINAEVLREITEQGFKSKLLRFEIPAKIKLCQEEWLPETGLVSAAMKLRRKYIEKHYQDDIQDMYYESPKVV